MPWTRRSPDGWPAGWCAAPRAEHHVSHTPLTGAPLAVAAAVDPRGRRRRRRRRPLRPARLVADADGAARADLPALPRPRPRAAGRAARPRPARVRQDPPPGVRGGRRRRPRRAALRPLRGGIPAAAAPRRRSSRCSPRRTEHHHAQGVVGIVSPWNYPLSLADHRRDPRADGRQRRRAAPGPRRRRSPRSQAVQLLTEAGLPESVLQVVLGDGPDGRAGGRRPHRLRLLHRLDRRPGGGSPSRSAGRLVGYSPRARRQERDVRRRRRRPRQGGRGRGPRLLLLRRAAVHLDRAAARARRGRRRVHQPVRRRRSRRCGWARTLAYGTDMGSLVSRAAARARSPPTSTTPGPRARGSSPAAGPAPTSGPYFYEPTVLEGVTAAMDAARRRDLRPGRVDLPRRTATTRRSGWPTTPTTASTPPSAPATWRAGAASRPRSRPGTVNINEGYAAAWGSVASPMGGMKQSGVGRRHGSEGILKYTESQNVTAQYVLPIAPVARHERGDLRPADDRGAASCSRPWGADDRRREARPRRAATTTSSSSAPGSAARSPRCAWPRRATGSTWSSPAAGSATRTSPRRRGTCAATCGRRKLKCFGVQRIHRLPDVMVLAGAGVGGGSLNYANTLYVPPAPFFADRAVGRHHRLAGRARAALRPGLDDARRGHQPVRGRRRGRHAADRRGPRRRRHLPQDPDRRLLRHARQARPRPVLRRRRSRPHRLHRVRQLHGRLPGRRQEHPGEELPRARREARGHHRADAHGRARRPAPRRRVCRDARGDAAPGSGVHGIPSPPTRWSSPAARGAPRSCCTRHAPDGRAAAAVRPAGPPDPHQLRGDQRRDDATGSRTGMDLTTGWRSRPRSTRTPTPTSRTAATARAPTRWARGDAARAGRAAAPAGEFLREVVRHPLVLPAVAVAAPLERADHHRAGHAVARQLAARVAGARGCSAGAR